MTFSVISPEEVRAKYNAAKDKGYMLGVLADLTASSKDEVLAFLGLITAPKRKKKTPVMLDCDEAKRLYDLGLSDRQIANELGVTKNTVGYWRRKNGFDTNTPNGVFDNRMELYRQGLNDAQIAEAVCVTASSICSWRHAHALPPNGISGGDHRSKAFRERKKRRCENGN